ncbi:VWA domain-containing protein [Rhodoferax sp. 4810]|nr:VWA domain-containing protein [Rhodoferax jenense]
MEEAIGQWWHHAVTRWAATDFPQARVTLVQMERAIGILFRAAGGDAAVRLAPAAAHQQGGPRNWLQRLAGSGQRGAQTRLEPGVLALPAELATFAETTLNRDLYLWLAIQSAFFEPSGDWLADNLRATQAGLAHFPGMHRRYARLLAAHLAQRPQPARLKGAAAIAEAQVQSLLTTYAAAPDGLPTLPVLDPLAVMPVCLWISAGGAGVGADRTAGTDPSASSSATQSDKRRRQTQQANTDASRPALVLPFHSGSLMTWSERVSVNRGTDDEDDGNALEAANDMDQLTVAADGQTLASRVKFDLDLPSSSADDLPMGPGIALPEWDYRKACLLPDHCRLQVMQSRSDVVFAPAPALRRTARQVRRRLEILRDVPRAQHGQESGDDIDLDAWVRFHTDCTNGAASHSDTPAVYLRSSRCERSLATLLLADLSLSTDAYVNDHQRVIDIIRDALYVFGEALHAAADPFAMWGFSSVRRSHVRLQHLKAFDEPWGAAEKNRVGAIKPGYYTRMGAGIRYATQLLQKRPERKRLLMLLTDGKPNDLDIYEGRYGLEDTRHALHEARQAGLTPFCVTIDEEARSYLPLLFGQNGFALVQRPEHLVKQLTQAWASLSRQ